MNEQKKMFLIKLPYWLGICADALWAVGLLFPKVFVILINNPGFSPDHQTKDIMLIGGILMTGWTFLLIWAVRKPVERRSVIFLTAFPVVFGIFFVVLKGFLEGVTANLWLLIKTTILFITMMISYILAGKMSIKRDKN